MQPRLAILAFAAAAAALAFVSPLEEVELRTLDMQYRALRTDAVSEPAGRVVVVGIDDRTVAGIDEPVGLWHGYIARFLEALREDPPALVALDIVMPDRSFEGVAPGLDRELLRALISTRAAFPTLLGITIHDDGRPRRIHPSFLAAAGTTPGFVMWPVDSDGTIRRFDEQLGKDGESVATLTGEAARRLGKEPRRGYIDYSLGAPMGYVAFADVLDAAARKDRAWLRERFAGKAVLVGMVTPYSDPVRVPVKLAAWDDVPERDTPGVLVHAQALRAIVSDRLVSRADAILVATLSFVTVLAGLAATSAGRGVFLAVALLLVLPGSAAAALKQGTFLPFVWPLVAGLASIAIVQGLEVASRLAERRRLRSSFAGAVSPGVMQQILDGRIVPQQGGVNLEVCVLFSDIRGYTTLSEGKSPEQIVALLNRYFDRMVDVIHATGGTVISFMGDGIMAVFGAPQRLPNNCAAGFDAAVAMLDKVRDFNRLLEAEGIAPIGIGVGLHVGQALVGHIGSKTRHDYTAIGDVTNVASRLESATKEAGFRIVISREVAEQLPDRSQLEHLGPVALKGHTPVDAYGYERVAPVAAKVPSAATAQLLGVFALAALLAGIVPDASAQRAAGATALVSDVQGAVRLVRGGERTPAKLLADLLPETRLELDGGARLVLLMLSTGEEVALKGPAQAMLAVDGVSSDPREAMTRRTTGVGGVQLRRKDLAQAAIVMRKTDQTVRPPLLSLAGTYTLEDPPVFRWTPVEASGPYRVTLFDDAGRVLHEATTNATEHSLPAAVSLAPERRYTWEVSTRKANGVEHANFGDFALASPELRREAAVRRPRPDAQFSERLAYAVWLDTRELGDAAREVWKRLATERPGDEQLRRMAEQ
jgi:class 3 adenylate cyclase